MANGLAGLYDQAMIEDGLPALQSHNHRAEFTIVVSLVQSAKLDFTLLK